MKKTKLILLSATLVFSGTVAAGWLDFFSDSSETADAVQDTSQETSSTVNAINNTVKAGQVANQIAQGGLVDTLVKQLNVTPTQAQGGAGALFQVAKSKMTDSAFSQLSQSVPGISGMLAAVPKSSSSTGGLLSGLANASGNSTLMNAASLVNTFKQLDMSKGMVNQFIPVVVNYVKQNSGEVTANLLKAALGGS